MSKEISPPKGRYYFDGGLNTKFDQTIIGDNESPQCQNVIFTNGAVETRDGFIKYNTTPIGTFVVDGLYTRHTNTGAATMVAFAGGSAWTLAGTTFATIGSAQSVFTAGVRVGATEYQQHLFIGNGGVIPYKYNGAAFTRHGVYPPTVTSTVATSSAGVLTGDYRYKVVYVNSQTVESDVGPVTATLAVATTRILLTSLPVAPQSFGVSSRRIYRTVTSGAVFKLVTTISDNTTTTFEDNVTDASLGDTAPTDHGVPPKYSFIIYHRDRLFCNDPTNPNFLMYSDLEEPYTFGAANFRLFGDNTINIVRAAAVLGENIAVFSDNGIEILYMPSTDDTTWLNVKVNSDYGCKSPFGIVKYDNGILFPAVQNNKFVGFAHLKGNALAPSVTFLTVQAAGSFVLSDKISPDMYDVKDSLVGNISGYVFKEKAYFSLPKGSSATENNRIYVFDFNISDLSKKVPYSWTPFTGLSAQQFADMSNTLFFGESTATGYIRSMQEGVYNDGTSVAIDSYYWTKEFGGDVASYNYWKDFRFANIVVQLAGNYFMNFSTRTDSSTASGDTQTILLDPGGSLWGAMVWGVDPWGGGSSYAEKKVDLGTTSGKRIQFKFDNQNTVNQKFKISGLNFLANVKGYR